MLKLRFLLSVLILAGLAVIGYSRFEVVNADTSDDCDNLAVFYEPSHYNEDGVMESKLVDRICFETDVEALKYYSDGAIDLPEDATEQEIEDAINAYYEVQKANDTDH